MEFSYQDMPWLYVLVPAIIVATFVTADNRFWGPYFAIADVVLGEPGAGMSLHDPGVLKPLIRRATYMVVVGITLAALGYSNSAVASVFFVTGFLLIWPAFMRPLPHYVNRSDWQVLLLWAAYLGACVAFGLAGANAATTIRVVTGQQPTEFLRSNLLWLGLSVIVGIVMTAFSEPVARSLTNKVRERYNQE